LHETVGLQELFLQEAKSFPIGLSASEVGMRLDISYTLPDDYLQKVDVSSMAFSLESREPLLDQDVVEWSMKLPVKWKLGRNRNKYLLRKLAYRYVPRAILNRPKRGFEVPIRQWLKGPLSTWASREVSNEENFKKLPLRRDRLIQLLQMVRSGSSSPHSYVWAILMLFDFMKNVPSPAEQVAAVQPVA